LDAALSLALSRIRTDLTATVTATSNTRGGRNGPCRVRVYRLASNDSRSFRAAKAWDHRRGCRRRSDMPAHSPPAQSASVVEDGHGPFRPGLGGRADSAGSVWAPSSGRIRLPAKAGLSGAGAAGDDRVDAP
jgi:hypothetical protein